MAEPAIFVCELDELGEKTRLILPDNSSINYINGENSFTIQQFSPDNEKLYSHEYIYDESGAIRYIVEDTNSPDSESAIITALGYLQTIVSNGAEALYRLNRYMSASMNHELETVGKYTLDESLYLLIGYKNEKTETGIVGNGEVNDKIRFTQTNGILNKKCHILDVAKMISEFHGGVNIHYTLRPSAGWTKDFVKGIMLKSGYVSSEAYHLAENWKALINDMGGVENGGIIIHFAHSIGGTETNQAKNLLTPEELKMIKVYTFGSATMVPNEGFADVINFVSKRDVVPLLDPVGYIEGLLSSNGNVIFIGEFIGFPLVDHLIAGENYSKILEELGKQFLEEQSDVSE